ncbi:phage Gp37/Gp68 family protein [Amorphus sp. 3PC139-8]|uniref:phage Gp37/Gp68 family protein n=1 Tax=Amorphus sp. 3PC139-8 TaxID=2735676 RepID=UPI00345D4F43
MGKHTAIEWADHTFSPWFGCTKISRGCDHCYAEAWARRAGNSELWEGSRRRAAEASWKEPLKWDRAAAEEGRNPIVFPSLCDPFDNQVPPIWRRDLFSLIQETPNLTWTLLTKRPQNIPRMLPFAVDDMASWPWSNVWLGTTAEDADQYTMRWPHMARVPAALRFLSYEPALDALGDLELGAPGAPDWVIAGGESGPQARPIHTDGVRSARDQCATAGVPFLFKQHGEWIAVEDLRHLADGSGPGFGAYDHCRYDPEREVVRIGSKRAGRLLDGVFHDAFPAVRPRATPDEPSPRVSAVPR